MVFFVVYMDQDYIGLVASRRKKERGRWPGVKCDKKKAKSMCTCKGWREEKRDVYLLDHLLMGLV